MGQVVVNKCNNMGKIDNFHLFISNLLNIMILKEDVKTLINYIDALSLVSEIIFNTYFSKRPINL